MKKISLAIFAAALVSLTSSCLKDGRVNLGPGAPVSPPVVQWSTAQIDDAPLNGNTALYRLFYGRTFPLNVTAINMALQVDLTGADVAPSDITVSLGTNTAAYTAFVAGATTNPQLPTTTYTMPATVTIPKGSRNATVNITVNSTTLDPTKIYYLPVAVTATTYGNVSGNYGTVIYQLNPANKYDGVYSYTNATTATFGAGITAPAAQMLTYVTTQAGTALSSVVTTFLQSPVYASNIIYTFSSTLNASGYYPITGISIPNFFIPSSIDPLSGYNPTTKVIRAKFVAGGYNFDETFTYVGPRASSK
jgi:hypothetical protein